MNQLAPNDFAEVEAAIRAATDAILAEQRPDGHWVYELEADATRLEGHADLIFAPSVKEMYPDGFATKIDVGGPSLGLETDFRPHFFGGVATVVSKLLIAAMPG